ncbi:MAG: GNAT family N-acetyltransferase [Lachnospiraceae bacterium]|nr:GNAT family N-acetyltransferase [Lachnospiraceae bacterium]
MEHHVKAFDELTAEELYDILRLRTEVFIVEQDCTYLETDGLDKAALHVWLADDDGIAAYLRIMDRGVESEHVSIGRVVAAKRGCGLGREVMEAGIRAAAERFGADRIYLEAQVYAEGFYQKLGFKRISEVFDLDGIPHIKMLLEL